MQLESLVVDLGVKLDLLLNRSVDGAPRLPARTTSVSKGSQRFEHTEGMHVSYFSPQADNAKKEAIPTDTTASPRGELRTTTRSIRSTTVSLDVQGSASYGSASPNLRPSVMKIANSLEEYRKTWTYYVPQDNCLGNFVMSPLFEAFILIVVLFNSILLGLQVNEQALKGTSSEFFHFSEHCCSAIFAVELVLRILGQRSTLLSQDFRHWAFMDIMLVIMSGVDFVLTTTSSSEVMSKSSTLRIIKVARVARVLRVFRAVRFLAKVRTMVTMIFGSLVSLFWLAILVMFVIYSFGIVLTQGATEWRRPSSAALVPVQDKRYEDVQKSFGSVQATVYTLFISMTGGVSWGEPAELTRPFGIQYFLLFSFFMFFVFFSVLNIVTGVFVDGAIQQAQKDRFLRLMQEEEAQKVYHDDLREFIMRLDANADGRISFQEWRSSINLPAMRSLMTALDIKVSDAIDLFHILDVDKDGFLNVAELLDGFERIRGQAQNYHIRMVENQLASMQKVTQRIASRLGLACDQGHGREDAQ